jgi:TRAP-type mannitol/chloroaromatic compound transport system permease small subunit
MSKKTFFIGQFCAISTSVYHITQADYFVFTIIVIGIIMFLWGIQSILAISVWGKINAEQNQKESNSNNLLMTTYLFMTLILIGFNLLMLSLEDNSHWHFG